MWLWQGELLKTYNLFLALNRNTRIYPRYADKHIRHLIYKDNLFAFSVDKADTLEPAPYYPGFPTWKTHGNTRYWDTRKRIMVPVIKPNYPFALLGEEGWAFLEPFLPIEITPYSKSELDTMIDFYADKHYINEVALTPAGRNEIHFLTGRNPNDFMEFSSWW